MSRTTAHMPHWVTCTWYEPVHHIRCPNNIPHRRWQRPDNVIECDLPPEPVRHPRVWYRRAMHRLGTGQTYCMWEPDWTGVKPYPPVPHWFVLHVWHNPERTRLRGELARARAEWRGSGGTDVDPEPRQARGSAEWMWW